MEFFMSIICKRCGGLGAVKAGKMNLKQRYNCKSCGYFFTNKDGRQKYSDEQRLQAILLFRKGLSLRSIAEIIGTNNVTILQWIRGVGRYIKELVLSQPIDISDSLDVIEIDEMWHYIQKKSENYGFGLLILVPKNASLPLKSALVEISRSSGSGQE
jgi:transposase-like protein